METKGNPVDTVIQYQLHKKSDGGDSFKCNYQEPYRFEVGTETVEITQELYDTDLVVKMVVDAEVINIGQTVTKYFVNLTPEIILSGRKLVTLYGGYFYIEEYTGENADALIGGLSFTDEEGYIIYVNYDGFPSQLQYNDKEFVNYQRII